MTPTALDIARKHASALKAEDYDALVLAIDAALVAAREEGARGRGPYLVALDPSYEEVVKRMRAEILAPNVIKDITARETRAIETYTTATGEEIPAVVPYRPSWREAPRMRAARDGLAHLRFEAEVLGTPGLPPDAVRLAALHDLDLEKLR